MKLFLRMPPSGEDQAEQVMVKKSTSTVVVPDSVLRNGVHQFSFLKLFWPEMAQNTLFVETPLKMVKGLLDNENCWFMTYGSIHSGKVNISRCLLWLHCLILVIAVKLCLLT